MSTYKERSNLTDSERQSLVDDGFVILRGVVPLELVKVAREIVDANTPKHTRRVLAPASLATNPKVLSVFKDSSIPSILQRVMGPFPDVVSCQVAVTPAHVELMNSVGAHVDGGWTGPIPTRADEIEPIRGRPLDAAKYFGENDEIRGNNDGLLWMDPDRRMSTGSYTALVGIALNDQAVPGNGQFGVMKGMHEEVEKAFIEQRDSGSVIGQEGLNWPRIRIDEHTGKPSLSGLSETVREKAKMAVKDRPEIEGWPWRELTPVCLRQGDAVITLHSCPHTATPNLGPNPRMNLYFRIRRWREGNPFEGLRKVGHGVSDHPDRGYFGQFLEYPESYDPWGTSIAKLCNHWSEWDFITEDNVR